MSRYDYRDPGTDPAYCDSLSDMATIQCEVCHTTIQVRADEDGPVVCDACLAANPSLTVARNSFVVDGEPWLRDGETWEQWFQRRELFNLAMGIDPAEHATHAVIDALGMLEQALVDVVDPVRAHALKRMIKSVFDRVNRLDLRASAKIDELVERRR